MIHEEICTYEVCKLAKERGFPQQYDSLTHIYGGKDSFNVGIDLKYKKSEGTLFDIREWNPCLNDIAAPTQNLLQRWLREEKKIEVYVRNFEKTAGFPHHYWNFMTDGNGKTLKVGNKMFDTYELALEDALAYSLKNLV